MACILWLLWPGCNCVKCIGFFHCIMQNYAENVTGFAQIKVVKRKSQQLFARQYYFKLLKSNVRTHGFRMQSISITDRCPHSKAPAVHVSPLHFPIYVRSHTWSMVRILFILLLNRTNFKDFYGWHLFLTRARKVVYQF